MRPSARGLFDWGRDDAMAPVTRPLLRQARREGGASTSDSHDLKENSAIGRQALTGKSTSQELFLTRFRRPTLTHAFERALDDALFEALAEARGAGKPEDLVQKFQSALDSLSELSGAQSYVATPSLASAYKAEAEQEVATPEPACASRIEATLTLLPGLCVDDLKRLRRRFALANHPDRVSAELREEASKAMAQANAEIDKALKRARDR